MTLTTWYQDFRSVWLSLSKNWSPVGLGSQNHFFVVAFAEIHEEDFIKLAHQMEINLVDYMDTTCITCYFDYIV